MTTAADEVVRALNDRSLWAVGPEANVFDEHVETLPDGTQEVFDKPRLERMAANNNRRDAIGQPCPMAVGHTKDGVPEGQQPAFVGYWRYFRVAWDERLGKWVIRALPYVRRGMEETARQYPRVSVERWPGADFFDPISILRVTPRQDLGQWTYERAPSGKVRYSMEYSMADATPPAAPTPAAAATPAAGPDEYARMKPHVARYMAECYPKLGEMHEKYAASMAPPGPAGGPPGAAAPPAADPTKPPSADVERMQRESLQIKYAQLEAQVGQERHARRLAEAERAVVQLEAESFRIPDRAAEVKRMAAMSEADQAAREAEIRACYQKSPVGGDFVRTAPNREGGGRQAMSRQQFEQAQKYQRDQQAAGNRVTWEAACAHVTGAA